MSLDSIAILEQFFQARLGTEVKAADVAALPPKDLERLLGTVFKATCTPSRGALARPTPNKPERADDRWAVAFHTPSALFSPRRICSEARRVLPMVLFFDRIAVIDPLGAVAHYAQDDAWRGITVMRMLLKRPAPNRQAFERVRRLRVLEAVQLLEEVNEVRDSVNLVPAANWGTEIAGSAWDWTIQMWAVNRAMDVDAGYEPRSDPRPDPDAVLAQYFRSAALVSLVAGDNRSWERAAVDIARQRPADSSHHIVQLLLAQPSRGSGRELRRLVDHDAALSDVRSTLSSALRGAVRLPSDDATERLLDAFGRSADVLGRRQRQAGPGTIELTASGLALGGVVLDLALTGNVAPSTVLDALAAQLPLIHSLHATRKARAAESVRGALIGVGRPLELGTRVGEIVHEPMTVATTRRVAARILADHAAIGKAAGIWPPRATYGSQVLGDTVVEWLWAQFGQPDVNEAVVTCDQDVFDRIVAFFETLHPIEPYGTWAPLVVDCIGAAVKENASLIQANPLVFCLRRPTWQ
jgi:hypothetical protein